MSALVLASVAAGAFVGIIIYVAVVVFLIAALWLVFAKADRPGWAAIIPFYNYYTMLKVVGRPGMVAGPLPHPHRELRRLDHRGDRLGEVVRKGEPRSR